MLPGTNLRGFIVCINARLVNIRYQNSFLSSFFLFSFSFSSPSPLILPPSMTMKRFASLVAAAATFSTAASALSTAETVANLRVAQTQVDRIKQLGDDTVRQSFHMVLRSLTRPRFSSLSSISCTQHLAYQLEPADIPSPHLLRTCLHSLAMVWQ